MLTRATNPGGGITRAAFTHKTARLKITLCSRIRDSQCAPAEALPRARGSNKHKGTAIAIKPAKVR
jgi:hypothetical protein